MHRLGMLTQVVKTRESSTAMALEWPFTSVFPLIKLVNVCRGSSFRDQLTEYDGLDARCG